MNLPSGPDTLCFDKDEFMKVEPGRAAEGTVLLGPSPRGLPSGSGPAGAAWTQPFWEVGRLGGRLGGQGLKVGRAASTPCGSPGPGARAQRSPMADPLAGQERGDPRPAPPAPPELSGSVPNKPDRAAHLPAARGRVRIKKKAPRLEAES